MSEVAGVEVDVMGAITRHFEGMDPEVRGRVVALTEQLGHIATERLLSTLPEVILTTPAALLDEDKLGRTMGVLRPGSVGGAEYFGIAMGEGVVGGPDDRYWVTLGGNTTPAGFEDPRAEQHLLPVVEEIDTQPDFALSALFAPYEPETPICTIRADLLDASILLYARQCLAMGKQPEDIMVGNFDADTRGAVLLGTTRSYVRQLADARRDSTAQYLEVYPRLGHQEVSDALPNMQRLVQWRDYMAAKFGLSFAAHYMVNLFGYLDAGGFNRQWDNNEQLQMGQALAARAVETGQRMETVVLNRVNMLVSPRRYVIELATGQHMGYGSLRVPPNGQLVHPEPEGGIEDISPTRFREELAYEVRRICERGLERFMLEYGQAHPDPDQQAARDYAFERIEALITDEAEGVAALPGMRPIILRTLAQYGEELEELRGT